MEEGGKELGARVERHDNDTIQCQGTTSALYCIEYTNSFVEHSGHDQT